MPYARLLALCTAATVAGASLVLSGAATAGASPRRPRRSSPTGSARSSPATRRRRRSSRCPTSFRCRPTPRRSQVAQTHRRSAVERHGLRARVRHDPARRHTRTIPAADVDRSRAVRSLARAGRRRRGDRRGAEGRRPSISVQVRLFRSAGSSAAFSKEYSGGATNPRVFAHTIADEMHKQQRELNGVARTKLAFSSDRDGERLRGTIEQRTIKEIYITDYDGENQRRITVNRSLNITPVWSADGRAIAYTSYRRNNRARHLRLVSSMRAVRPRRRPAAPTRSTTSCRRGRPTARASRSCRIATATSRSTW